MRRMLAVTFAVGLLVVPAAAQKPGVLSATTEHDAVVELAHAGRPSFQTEEIITFAGHFARSPERAAPLSLSLVAEALGPDAEAITLRIPLASTAEAYGESRSCTAASAAAREHVVFTAGLDEHNFIFDTGSGDEHSFRLLLNKYLCRALVAPFHCRGGLYQPLQVVSAWRVGPIRVELRSALPATFAVTRSALEVSPVRFDYARCAAIAPSNGLCCVEHKTTEWHCGGSPSGAGWHQVSGDCFHRETGTSCKE